MTDTKRKTYTMTSAALMTAVMCILAPVSVPIGPIPISLATLVIYFSIFILGTSRALLSCVLYILIGAVGLPVFSGFSGGATKLFGPTGGYILGYLFLILISGIMLEKLAKGKTGVMLKAMQLLSLIIGTAVLYTFGLMWFCRVSGMAAGPALALTVYPFIPLDLCKIILAVIIAPVIADKIKTIV